MATETSSLLVPPRSGPKPASRAPSRGTIWSSAQWVAYFRGNNERRMPVPWEAGAGVTPEELAAVAASLRAWQLGETSDGRRLVRTAERYAAWAGDPEFVEATRLFIGEEQRHGAELGRFLDLAGVPRATWNWGDALFRFARYWLPGVEGWATPVVMVEAHAMLYYAALRRATGSPVLRAVCKQILADEVPHLRFQCERLAAARRRRPRVFLAATVAAHRLFFAATTLAVWVGHRRALRAGGYSLRSFWRASWATMRPLWKRMDPRGYDWPADVPPAAG